MNQLKTSRRHRSQNVEIAALLVLFATLSIALPRPARAGSLIRLHLATIDELRIKVSTGGMSYDRIPGLDLEHLAQSIHGASLRQFQDCGIATLEDAPVTLYVSISKKKIRDLASHVVILIEYELAEPAHLVRALPAGDDSPTIVSSWHQNRTIVTEKSEAMNAIVGASAWVVEELARKIVQARRSVAGNTEEAGEPCF